MAASFGNGGGRLLGEVGKPRQQAVRELS